MGKLSFFYNDVKPIFEKENSIASTFNKIISLEKFTLHSLNFIFCTDSFLHQINLSFLNHDYYTDVVTFDNSDLNHTIEADIYISIDRVQDNSCTFQTTFWYELLRVMIHGLLHLLGYDDKSAQLASLMRAKENYYLDFFKDF